jgi:hypothetical protein
MTQEIIDCITLQFGKSISYKIALNYLQRLLGSKSRRYSRSYSPKQRSNSRGGSRGFDIQLQAIPDQQYTLRIYISFDLRSSSPSRQLLPRRSVCRNIDGDLRHGDACRQYRGPRTRRGSQIQSSANTARARTTEEEKRR